MKPGLPGRVARRCLVGITLTVVLALWAMPAVAITWGEPDTAHTNVGAMVVDDPDFGIMQWCSGTLVHPQVFLTAAHCTADLDYYGITDVWVNFDPYALNAPTMRPVAQVITHPDYFQGAIPEIWGSTSNPHDAAVLILEEPVAGITPATLPPEGFLDELASSGQLRTAANGAEFTVVGYGGTLSWPPPEIAYDDRRQMAISEFQTLLPAWLRMSQNQATGDGGTCSGDSGGPAFWTEPDGSEILVGITSWGDQPCVATGFNYRVDIDETLSFIATVIATLP